LLGRITATQLRVPGKHRDESASVERRDEMAKAAKPASQMTDEELMAVIREGQAKEAEERKPSN